MYSFVTDMNFKTNTTHVVIKFNRKLNGKDCIDLILISWTLINDGLWQCKYLDKNEYSKIDMLSKTSSDCKIFWKSFGISVISEARKYLFTKKKLIFDIIVNLYAHII